MDVGWDMGSSGCVRGLLFAATSTGRNKGQSGDGGACGEGGNGDMDGGEDVNTNAER